MTKLADARVVNASWNFEEEVLQAHVMLDVYDGDTLTQDSVEVVVRMKITPGKTIQDFEKEIFDRTFEILKSYS